MKWVSYLYSILLSGVGEEREELCLGVPSNGQNPPWDVFCAPGGVLCPYHWSCCTYWLEKLVLPPVRRSPFEGYESLVIYWVYRCPQISVWGWVMGGGFDTRANHPLGCCPSWVPPSCSMNTSALNWIIDGGVGGARDIAWFASARLGRVCLRTSEGKTWHRKHGWRQFQH